MGTWEGPKINCGVLVLQIIRDEVVPEGHTYYAPTEKQLPEGRVSKAEQAWEYLASRMVQEFGKAPVNIKEIYSKITGPVRLSYYETADLVKSAKNAGYLESVRL